MFGFSKQQPDAKLNFFQNYNYHLNHINKRLNEFSNQAYLSKNANELFTLISDGAINNLTLFEPLHDGYDYADEVLGASVLPLLGFIATTGFLIKALFDLSLSAAINYNLINDDQKSHHDVGITLLCAAVLTAAISTFSLLKSIFSLITRPISTILNGWDKRSTNRFLNDKDADEIDHTALTEMIKLVI